jgi:nucleotide-binding universal stress UspA family protein
MMLPTLKLSLDGFELRGHPPLRRNPPDDESSVTVALPAVVSETQKRKGLRFSLTALEFQALGIPTEAELAYGEPANEIIKWVRQKGCDLVAMSTHGHRFLSDIFLGTTASRVQHSISVPVLLLRAK